MDILIESLRWFVLVTGVFDSWKYKFLSQKVARMKSSREISRKFINVSIIYRIFLLIYAWCVLRDWVITWTCIIALYTLAEAFHAVYWYYPYKKRGLRNFKRPSMTRYVWNSIVPNRWAKRL